LVFVLDGLGQRIAELLRNQSGDSGRPRRPSTPTQRFLAHSLAVTEL
jgi:hypothetical protein